MPELPEVESIRIQLEKFLVGHVIKDIKINYSKTFKERDKQKIINSKIKSVRRFGKVLVIRPPLTSRIFCTWGWIWVTSPVFSKTKACIRLVSWA